MSSLIEKALGADWEQLPEALRAHYRDGTATDRGHLDIEFPRFMRPAWWLLHRLGALIDGPGRAVETVVEKRVDGQRQYWHRRLRYADGYCVRFNSFWVGEEGNEVTEYVNSWLGLRMAAWVEDGTLRYRGRHYVLKLGPWRLKIPCWLALGDAHIVENAIGENRFAMDFRLVHPLFGELFRYSGTFESHATRLQDF